jgi:enoyl-CoA hydratase/carnithine racemase
VQPFVGFDVVRIFAAAVGGRASRSPNVKPVPDSGQGDREVGGGPRGGLREDQGRINAATLTELEPALAREFNGQSGLLRANDLNEGTKAFQEKRAPVFTDS